MSKRNPYEAPRPKVSEYSVEVVPEEVVAPVIEIQADTSTQSEDTVTTVEVVAPEGSVKDVLDWVDEDKQRAQVALDAEEASEKPRVTLVKELEEVLKED